MGGERGCATAANDSDVSAVPFRVVAADHRSPCVDVSRFEEVGVWTWQREPCTAGQIKSDVRFYNLSGEDGPWCGQQSGLPAPNRDGEVRLNRITQGLTRVGIQARRDIDRDAVGDTVDGGDGILDRSARGGVLTRAEECVDGDLSPVLDLL